MTFVPRYHLGAVSSTSLFDFQAEARRLASFSFSPFVFVGMGPRGSSPTVKSLGSRSALADAFDAAASSPGSFAYIAMFDKNSSDNGGLVDEAKFTSVEVVETKFTVQRFKKNLPFILAGLAGVAGVVYYTRKQVKRRAAAKRSR